MHILFLCAKTQPFPYLSEFCSGMFFVFLAGFSAIGVLMVLKTTNKVASKDDSTTKEIASPLVMPIRSLPYQTPLAQPAKPEAQPIATTSSPNEGTPLGVPSTHSIPATSLAPLPKSVVHGNTLVFDDTPEGPV